jgi:mannose-1-phosphate guanylyltransferase
MALGGVFLEPVQRNTCLAIAAAAATAIKQHGPETILHVLPSDHSIEPDEDYWGSVQVAANAAAKGGLVTFGVTPIRPETGYGYIEKSEQLDERVFRVARFTEKPNAELAEEFAADQRFLWNSGMFMFSAGVFWEQCVRLAPATAAAAEAALAELDVGKSTTYELLARPYEDAPSVAVDVAIFEKTDRAQVVPVGYSWSDLGSWDGLWTSGRRDAAGNLVSGPTTVSNTTDSLVFSNQSHVVVEGLDGVAVVVTEDAVLVSKLSDTQKVGKLVEALKRNPSTSDLTRSNKTTFRPWGGYASVLQGDRFQVKKLFVKPGKKLSLQKHHHRSEHWVVVRGTAQVTIDGNVSVLGENESVYLPLGCVHRLANPGKIMLEIIEVQTGSYLGEDDIIRLEDEFGRA